MSTTAEALRRALSPRAPDDVAGLVDVAGGRAELARRMVGIRPGARLPGRGTEQRRAYETQARYLRYAYAAPAEGRRRRPYPAASLRRARQVIQPSMRRWFVDELRSAGARARMAGRVIIAGYAEASKIKHREMPRGGPGLYLSPERVEVFTRPALAGEWEIAGGLFERVFGEAYGVDIEMDDVTYIRLWPEGAVE